MTAGQPRFWLWHGSHEYVQLCDTLVVSSNADVNSKLDDNDLVKCAELPVIPVQIAMETTDCGSSFADNGLACSAMQDARLSPRGTKHVDVSVGSLLLCLLPSAASIQRRKLPPAWCEEG